MRLVRVKSSGLTTMQAENAVSPDKKILKKCGFNVDSLSVPLTCYG